MKTYIFFPFQILLWLSASALGSADTSGRGREKMGIIVNGINARVQEKFKWPDATVYYKISANFTCQQKCIIHEAILEMEKNTCLNFIERQHRDGYVDFIKGSKGVGAKVGFQRTVQKVQLTDSDALSIGEILHQLMHVVGFFHEHSRRDRDQYVTVFWDNIDDRHLKNFEPYPKQDPTITNEPYDYESITHYGPKEFSYNGKDTIQTKLARDKMKIGQRNKLSDGDINRINRYYNCPSNRIGCIDSEVNCKEEGFFTECENQNVRETVCRKLCQQCPATPADCPLCRDHGNRCEKFAETSDCPNIEISVRNDYYNDCELC